MATATLNVTSVVSATGWSNATVANLTTSNDVRATGGTAGELINTEITDAPADYLTGNTVTLNVEARVIGTVSRQKTILVELTDSTGSTVHASFETTNLTSNDATYSSSPITLDLSSANLSSARLRATVQEGGGMSDSASVEIDRLWIDLDYDPSLVTGTVAPIAISLDPIEIFEPVNDQGPNSISGCVVWLDPDTLSLSDGNTVNSWPDSSFANNNPTFFTGDDPIYRDGSNNYYGKPEIVLESTAQRFAIPQPKALSSAGSWALAMRIRPRILYKSASDYMTVLSEDSAGTNASVVVRWGPPFGANRWVLGARDSAGTFTNDRMIGATIYPVGYNMLLTYDGSDYRFYLDDWDTPHITLNVTSEMSGSGLLTVGNSATDDTESFMGAFGDVVLYDNIPSSGDITKLRQYFESEWGYGRTERIGAEQDGAHNIPSDLSDIGYRTASIKKNPDGTHYDMLAAETVSGDFSNSIHWFQALGSDPHNWTHMNGGSGIINPAFQTVASSFVWFSGELLVYYEDRENGGIYHQRGSNFDSLTDYGLIIDNPGGNVYYRHPAAWVRDNEVYMILDERQGSATAGQGHLVATHSPDGSGDWAAVNTLLEDSTVEDGIADDVGAPSVLPPIDGSGETLLMFAGFNEDFRTASQGIPHSIWYASFDDPMSGQATLVKDGAVMAGKIAYNYGTHDCLAHNSPEFYDRRDVDGNVDIYVDGQDTSGVVMVLFNELVLTEPIESDQGTPSVVTTTLTTVSPTVQPFVNGTPAPTTTTLNLNTITAGQVLTGAIAPETTSLSIIDPASAFSVDGTVDPVSITLDPIEVDADEVLQGTVDPETVSLSVQSTTATFHVDGTVAPVTTSLTTVSPTAEVMVEGTVDPVSTSLTVIGIAASSGASQTGTVAPVTTLLSVVEPTVAASVVVDGTVTPETATLSVVDPTVTFNVEGSVQSSTTSLSAVEPAATFNIDGAVAPETIALSTVGIDAEFSLDGTVSPNTISLTVIGVDAGLVANAATSPLILSSAIVSPTAETTLEGSIAPSTTSLTVVSVSAEQTLNATVSPVTFTLSVVEPNVDGTVVPVTTTLSVVSVSASTDQSSSGNVNAEGITLNVVSVTSTFNIDGIVSPVVTTLSTVDPTATFNIIGSVAPISSTLSIVEPEATFNIDGVVVPSTVSLSIIDIAASTDASTNGTVNPVVSTLSIVDPTADLAVDGTVESISTSLTVVQPSATVQVSGTVSPVSIASSVVEPDVEGIVLGNVVPETTSISAVEPEATFNIDATTSPQNISLSVVEPEATFNIDATVSPVAQSLSVVSPTANTDSSQFGTVSPLGTRLGVIGVNAKGIVNTNVPPETISLGIVDPSADHVVNGVVTPISASLGVVNPTAIITSIQSGTVSPLAVSLLVKNPSIIFNTPYPDELIRIWTLDTRSKKWVLDSRNQKWTTESRI